MPASVGLGGFPPPSKKAKRYTTRHHINSCQGPFLFCLLFGGCETKTVLSFGLGLELEPSGQGVCGPQLRVVRVVRAPLGGVFGVAEVA